MMSTLSNFPLKLLATGLMAASLAGCSAGDVQLNGKVFDALGGLVGTGGANEEAKVAPRAGLVLPPALDRLPEPGSAVVPDGDLAQISDFDRKKVVDKSALEAKQREYCKVNYEQAKQRGDQTADMATGPLGLCRPSAMGMISEISGSKQ
jgi:hypothetical protein